MNILLPNWHFFPRSLLLTPRTCTNVTYNGLSQHGLSSETCCHLLRYLVLFSRRRRCREQTWRKHRRQSVFKKYFCLVLFTILFTYNLSPIALFIAMSVSLLIIASYTNFHSHNDVLLGLSGFTCRWMCNWYRLTNKWTHSYVCELQ